MTIPNLLTLARIFLTPLLALLLLRKYMTAAFLVFCIAGLTDAFDGLLARGLNQKSRLGSYIDPLADKLLLVTSFLLLWNIGEIPLWLVIITVGRDLLILCGFFVLVFCRVRFEIKPLAVKQTDDPFSTGDGFHTAREINSGTPGVDVHGPVRHNGRFFDIELEDSTC